MATQASLDQIQNLFIAFYGRPADAAGQAYWADELETAGGDLSAIINAFANSAEYDSQYGDLDEAELVNALYQQILGRDAEEDGIDYYVSQLNNGNLTKGEMALAILNGAQNDDAAVLENRKAVADAFTAAVEAGDKEYSNAQIAAAKALLESVNAETDPATVDVDAVVGEFPTVEVPVEPGQPGEDIFLTASTDILTGTENDDTFLAYMSQNELVGGVSNSLSSADRLDGGEGNDSLYAEIVPEFYGSTGNNQIDIQPRIENIETIDFQARDFGGNINDGGTVTVDAKNIKGVDTIGSQQSDGDLVIENLTTLDNDGGIRSTSEMTISMDHTDNFNSDRDASDLTVYFDEDYLIPTENLGVSGVIFKIMNQDAYDQNGGEDRLDGVFVARMEFSLDGVRYDLADYIEEDPAGMGSEFKTEAELVAYLNSTALPALAAAHPEAADALNSLEFRLGNKWNDANQNRIGDEIVLEASNAYELETKDAWLTIDQAEGVPTGYASNRIERTDELTGEDTEELSVNVDLHKVGREGNGGDLVIGGKSQHGDLGSNGYTGEGKGINIFNIDVLGNESKLSNLGAISSTNDALQVVNIETHADYVAGDSYASLTVRNGFGQNQWVGDSFEFVSEALDLVDADSFLGDLSLGTVTDVLNLGELNANGGGDVEFHGDITVDGNYNYDTGAGDDTIVLDIDTESVDRWDDQITVTTDGGDDSVVLRTADNGAASQQTMALFSNMDISTGAGEDTVTVTGDGRFNIDTDASSDYVFINSVDSQGAETGAWWFGRESASDAANPAYFADQVLYKATLTLTFAGLESTVNIDTVADDNFIADQLVINAAIIEAINASPELSKLLDTTLLDGDQELLIESLVDGENDLEINIYQPDVVADDADEAAGEVEVESNHVDALILGLGLDSDSDEADIAAELDANVIEYQVSDLGGSADATGAENVNFSVINLGDGTNDLVVLDSNDNSANTLVIDGGFGKNTVLNFHNEAPIHDNGVAANVGAHLLDFTAILNNMTDDSENNNTLSQAPVAVTLNTFEANSVNILDMTSDLDEDWTFDTLSANDLLDALNGEDVDADFGIGEENPDATSFLVGDTQHHIVMVENDLNDGEYKVFHVTSKLDNDGNLTGANGDEDGDEADFNNAVLLGVLDFGDSLNGLTEENLVGSASWAAAVQNLLVAADLGVEVPVPTDVTVDASAANINEGETVNFALTGEADTEYTYTLTGVEAADVTDGVLTGTVTTDANGNASVTVELAADATTEGEETLTLTVDGVSASVVVNDTSVEPVAGVVEVPVGSTGTVEATAEADVISFDAVAALANDAQDSVSQVTLNGFDVVNDTLQLNLDTLEGQSFTLAELAEADGIGGVEVFVDPFANAVLAQFGNDAMGNEVVSLTLAGITDASLVNVDVI